MIPYVGDRGDSHAFRITRPGADPDRPRVDGLADLLPDFVTVRDGLQGGPAAWPMRDRGSWDGRVDRRVIRWRIRRHPRLAFSGDEMCSPDTSRPSAVSRVMLCKSLQRLAAVVGTDP